MFSINLQTINSPPSSFQFSNIFTVSFFIFQFFSHFHWMNKKEKNELITINWQSIDDDCVQESFIVIKQRIFFSVYKLFVFLFWFFWSCFRFGFGSLSFSDRAINRKLIKMCCFERENIHGFFFFLNEKKYYKKNSHLFHNKTLGV